MSLLVNSEDDFFNQQKCRDARAARRNQAVPGELARARTTLVIAHRLATIRGADRIVVVSDSGIVEQGSHSELLSAGGIYRRLHDAQHLASAHREGGRRRLPRPR
ncbi:hypothetical protein AJ88_24330 [Mesorhizobium amorphae CCBAU 01583]|nr:hypothetical protein AJ88_24330 [Mesorhizobium amorphae CCBAU 01583]